MKLLSSVIAAISCYLFWIRFPLNMDVSKYWVIAFGLLGLFYVWVAGYLVEISWKSNSNKDWRYGLMLCVNVVLFAFVLAEGVARTTGLIHG